MATLQVRDLDDRLYELLKTTAKLNHRSLSQEVVHILEIYGKNPDISAEITVQELLSIADSWMDDRPAEEIACELRASRTSSWRFENSNVLFD